MRTKFNSINKWPDLFKFLQYQWVLSMRRGGKQKHATES
jgi:hypothetical protein